MSQSHFNILINILFSVILKIVHNSWQYLKKNLFYCDFDKLMHPFRIWTFTFFQNLTKSQIQHLKLQSEVWHFNMNLNL